MTGRGERVVLWVAVSSAPQAADDRASLPVQEADLRARAEQMGWRVVDVLYVPGHSRAYVDIHECAADMRAAGIDAFDRLIEHWKRRDFEVLACRDGDRFGRKQTIFSYVVERTIDNGARLYTLSDGWIDEHNFRMAISMGSYKAASEIDALRRRHEFGMRGRVKRGLPAGLVPATHVLLRDASNKPLRLIVDESKRRLFDDIYDLLCHERVIIRGMEAHLAERGHARLGDRVIDSWLRNPYTWGHSARRFVTASQRGNWRWVYDPTVTPPDGVELWRDTHEAVWKGDQAADIRAELDRRQATYGGHYLPYRSYRYSGLCICADCGSPVSYRVYRDRYRYMRCNRTCFPGNLKEAVVTDFVRGLLERVIAGVSMADLTRTPPDTSAERRRQVEDEITQVTAQAAALIRKQAAAPAALFSLYDDELTALAARLDALERERARIQPPSDRSAAEVSERALRERGLAWFWDAPEIEQNAILHALFGRWRIAVTNRGIEGIVSARSS